MAHPLPLTRLACALMCLALAPSMALAQVAPVTSTSTAPLFTPFTAPGALPSLGDNSELSAAAERRIGERIAASIYRDPDYIDDPVLVDYVQSIWQPLLAAARARGELSQELDERFAWTIFLARDRSINAFALPGGYFGLHLGLIGVVSSRDELAAVLGHELSHVTQRHISRLLTQQSRQAPWLIASMILAALVASKSAAAANAAIVGGQALAAQGQLNFSRDMEREADRVGFGVMVDAGFDARGVGSMFEKLQQSARLNDSGGFAYLRSHPLTVQRIAEVQSRLQLVSAPSVSSANTGAARTYHAMMAARAKVLVDPGVDALRALVAEASSPKTPSAGVLYGAALASAKLRDYSTASVWAQQLQTIVQGDAARRAGELLLLELDLMAGKVPPNAASIDLTKTTARADVLVRGRALLAAGQPQVVSSRLYSWVAEHPKDAGAWQMLSTAFNAQGQAVRAIRADAEAHVVELDYPAALDRFKAAQALMREQPGAADFMESSIIDTRARQVALLVKEQALQDKVDR